MTPYEVFFFFVRRSGGEVDADLVLNKANVYLGFPLGGLLSLKLMAGAALVFHPLGVGVDNLSQVASHVDRAGKVGFAFIIGLRGVHRVRCRSRPLSVRLLRVAVLRLAVGRFPCDRDEAARFHLVALVSLFVAVVVGVTAVDPIKVTEYSIVLSAAALPLTYFPILVVANDRTYMGDEVNGPVKNADRDLLHGRADGRRTSRSP